MIMLIMTYWKSTKPKAANDNKHDPFYWELLHTYVDRFLTDEKIPVDKWHYNRSIHYTYELFNRPWLPKNKRIDDLINWLRAEQRHLEYGIGDFAGMN